MAGVLHDLLIAQACPVGLGDESGAQAVRADPLAGALDAADSLTRSDLRTAIESGLKGGRGRSSSVGLEHGRHEHGVRHQGALVA